MGWFTVSINGKIGNINSNWQEKIIYIYIFIYVYTWQNPSGKIGACKFMTTKTHWK
jgi:hypothetical protein